MEKQLSISSEELKELQRFKKLYGTEEDNQDVVDYFYKVFLYAYINGNKDVKFFVKRFNEIKEKDKGFHLSRERDYERMSFYNPIYKKIFVYKGKIDNHDEAILFHEGMHLFHEYSSLQSQEPREYEKYREKAFTQIINNKESILKETSKIEINYEEFLKKAREYVYKNFIIKAGANNVEDYINKEKNKYEELIQKKDIYHDLLAMGLNHKNAIALNTKSLNEELTTHELLYTYIQQVYQEKIDDYINALEPEYIAYEGFLGAILQGEQQEEFLIVYGHKREYFQNDRENGFKEVLAHYSELKNTPEGQKWIDILKNQIGEEFLNYIDLIYSIILTNPYDLSLESENKMVL